MYEQEYVNNSELKFSDADIEKIIQFYEILIRIDQKNKAIAEQQADGFKH